MSTPYVEAVEQSQPEPEEGRGQVDLLILEVEEMLPSYSSGSLRPVMLFPESNELPRVRVCPAGLLAMLVMVESSAPVSMEVDGSEVTFAEEPRELVRAEGRRILAHLAVLPEPASGLVSLTVDSQQKESWAYVPFCARADWTIEPRVEGSQVIIEGDLRERISGAVIYTTIDDRERQMEVTFSGTLPLTLPLAVEDENYILNLQVRVQDPFPLVYLLY